MGLSIDSEPGVILHTRPYQENSLLVELYTLNYGRISAVARISKKVSSRARGIYQPYALLKLSLSKGKSSLFLLRKPICKGRHFILKFQDCSVQFMQMS